MERPGERWARLTKDHRPECRASVRFPLTLEVRYSGSPHGVPPETGSGHIIDLSSSGLRFTAETPLLAGLSLDLSIDWPVLLDGGVQLQLIASGVIVWTSDTETALRVHRQEFRTRHVGLKAVPPQESVG